MLQADKPMSASLALRPWPGLPATLLACMHSLTGPCIMILQTIRVRADGQLLDCLMVQLEESIGSDNARIAAMQHLAPIPTFLFTSRGQLVIANQKALTKCSALSECSSHFQHHAAGQPQPQRRFTLPSPAADKDDRITLWDLFMQGIYEGGPPLLSLWADIWAAAGSVSRGLLGVVCPACRLLRTAWAPSLGC